MPTIDVNLKDLQELIGKKLSFNELNELVLFAKSEIDSKPDEQGNFKIDVKDTNRPDLWSAEGIAREIKGQLGLEKGLPDYKVKKSGLQIIVDENVKDVRPVVLGAIIKGIKVNEPLLVQLIQLQEKVCLTFGRKRKEAAIGIYDFDKIKWPVHYKAFKPKELKFAPLEFEKEMDLDEILELHPKGKEYGELLKGKKHYPILIDSAKQVCSMPPIINSNYTGKVTEKTRNLFVEVTGFDLEIVGTALNVMIAALADRKAGIESIEVVYGNKKIESPDLKPKSLVLDESFVQRISGLMLSEKELIELLEKRRMNASKKQGKLLVSYPAYRNDVLHEIDLVEDIIISFGYNSVDPELPKLAVTGSENKGIIMQRKVRECCIGLGLQEVLSFNLTSKEKQEKKMRLKGIDFVEIMNPLSINQEVFRKSIIPELLDFLSRNKHVVLPQAVFEIGKTLHLNPKNDNGTEEKNVLSIVVAASQIDFTRIKSVLQSIAQAFGWKFELIEGKHASFIPGRQALIKFSDGRKGIIGEMHPEVIENFGLETPVVTLEIEL